MALRFVPFAQHHMHLLTPQPAQEREHEMLVDTPEALDELAKGPAFTAIADGDVIGCGGIVEHYPGRCAVWAIVGWNAGPHMRPVTRMVRDVVARYPCRRIEATVRRDFKPGARWVKMLGFRWEGVMRAYSPLGETVIMFARINNDRP